MAELVVRLIAIRLLPIGRSRTAKKEIEEKRKEREEHPPTMQ
jgi:hypothetical protein